MHYLCSENKGADQLQKAAYTKLKVGFLVTALLSQRHRCDIIIQTPKMKEIVIKVNYSNIFSSVKQRE